jgi:hypothetical protein
VDIFVFKTDIHNSRRAEEASPHLNSIKGILKWNFDLEDADNILRTESVNLSPDDIESALGKAGFLCEELPD